MVFALPTYEVVDVFIEAPENEYTGEDSSLADGKKEKGKQMKKTEKEKIEHIRSRRTKLQKKREMIYKRRGIHQRGREKPLMFSTKIMQRNKYQKK